MFVPRIVVERNSENNNSLQNIQAEKHGHDVGAAAAFPSKVTTYESDQEETYLSNARDDRSDSHTQFHPKKPGLTFFDLPTSRANKFQVGHC
jgi:hypothetical protein